LVMIKSKEKGKIILRAKSKGLLADEVVLMSE